MQKASVSHWLWPSTVDKKEELVHSSIFLATVSEPISQINAIQPRCSSG